MRCLSGVVVSIWTGSRAVNRYLETMTIAYGLEPRPAWRRRLLALCLTVGALLGAVAVLPPLVLGPDLVRWLMADTAAATTLDRKRVVAGKCVYVRDSVAGCSDIE